MSLMLNDEVILGNDSRYKNFIVAIDKVLKQFEYSTEWADLITNLVKVKKTIESHSQFQSIPKRITLTKRLAQCLHPGLPSGVHLKTLEVYDAIFQIIGKRHLQRDIILYSHGLFPLLSVAALPVKPILLTLYETYFLPLGEALNSILTGFLIGLFSALEEGADYHDRIISVLDNLANRLDEFYFYTSIWSAIHLVASVRYPAITFILNHYDKRKNMDDQIHLIGLPVETMVSAVCSCLQDTKQSLAQRSILDFLLVCLPIHEKQLTKIDKMKIVTNTLNVLLNGDTSLNRRVDAWFLGTEQLRKDNQNHEEQMNDIVNESVDSSAYFIQYTQKILIQSLKNSLEIISNGDPLLTSTKPDDDDNKPLTNIVDSLPVTWTLIKLIRVLFVLVDKPDVGPNIIESVFMNYLLLVYEQVYNPSKQLTSYNIQQKNNYSETLKTFNMLLDTLEPYFIWEFLTKNIEIILNQQQDQISITAGSTIEQMCGIITMLLDRSSLEPSTDTQSEHLPEMICRLINIMNDNIGKLTPNQITLCIQILLKILKTIHPTDINHSLSIFHNQQQMSDNEYSTDRLNKLQNSSLTAEQDDIERLLRQMVHKVAKQIPLSDEKQTELLAKPMLAQSIELYKIFFHRFIMRFFIDQNQILMNEKFENIYEIIQNKTDENLMTIFNRYAQLNELKLKLNKNVNQYSRIFEDCCKLLIEFCCFSRQSSINEQSILVKDISDFDDWLIDLCILSICKSDHFILQTTSISVLIELFGYTLSLYNSNNANSILSNNLSITPEQISNLLNETHFFHYIIAYLWEYLSDKYGREYNSTASHLLSILHSMLPNNLCEDLICNELSLPTVDPYESELKTIESYKRFFKLWNSTRDVSILTNEYLTKSFQRCLLCVLNSLKKSNEYCLKSMVQQWIYDCFIHGDISRIFDIIFIRLLHSDTTRINIHKEFFLDEQINSKVSNDIDEITFSVAFNDDEYIYDYEAEQEQNDEKRRIRAISCINPSEAVYHVKSFTQPIKSPSILSLSQPILTTIRSFSPPTLLKSVKQRAPTMSTIFSRSNNHTDSNSNIRRIQTSSMTIDKSPRTHSMIIDNNVSDSIDLDCAYILLYTQSYDYNRVTSALNIIESLIDLIPQQLIHTLLKTANIQLSPINIHNHYMRDLFLKHHRPIEGNDFDISNEHNQKHQSYLYLLLNILLRYTRSYYTKSFDIQTNHKVHMQSLILLTRICHDLSYICMDNTIYIYYVDNLFKTASFQKIILYLFNNIINKKSYLSKLQRISDPNTKLFHDQLTKQLIRLLEEIILLENIIYSTNIDLLNQHIVNQTIFLSTILQYLKQIQFIDNHRDIISLVVRILPHCGSALKTISTRVIEQICRNVCIVVQYYSQQETKIKFKQLSYINTIDYINHLIQRLSYIVNYSLGNPTDNVHYFTQTLCPQHWMIKITNNANNLSDARQSILNNLSSILSSLLYIWKIISIDHINSIWSIDNIKQIQLTIIEFVSSLTKSNGVSLLHAVVQCWGERKGKQKSSTILSDNIGEIQALIDILMHINDYTINCMIYDMNELIRNQLMITDEKRQHYVIWCLQFLLVYFEQQNEFSLDYWSTLAFMLKEFLSQTISPPVTFLIIRILSFYVKQSPFLVEKRDLKDLQDITMKALENCNAIVASSLEQTNWLRKNLQVRPVQPDPEITPIGTDLSNATDPVSDGDHAADFDDISQPINSSLFALSILAEHAAKLLDIVYNLSDEKDRVVLPYLQTLITNVMPYVRIHILSNASSYRSVSTLLMNISQYSYTRKSWKKEVLEQLFDTAFFQVDLVALRSWKIILDNMITNEKFTSFRDVINRMNTVQTGLFASKEYEYEQRAMLVKRFAFVIYVSENDRYSRQLPEILECITDLLKLPRIPILHTQIFLFLRVLSIKISSKNFIPFWPILMAELIQVLLQLEQDILFDIEDERKSNVHRVATHDLTLTNISSPSSGSNPLLKMYLYACKLLDVLLAMPYSESNHFQLFRSAFVADHDTNNQNSDIDTFISFSLRLFTLLDQKLQSMPASIRDHLSIITNCNRPLLRLRTISNIIELFPFFNCLASEHIYKNSFSGNEQILLPQKINEIDKSILEDFVESWI